MGGPEYNMCSLPTNTGKTDCNRRARRADCRRHPLRATTPCGTRGTKTPNNEQRHNSIRHDRKKLLFWIVISCNSLSSHGMYFWFCLRSFILNIDRHMAIRASSCHILNRVSCCLMIITIHLWKQRAFLMSAILIYNEAKFRQSQINPMLPFSRIRWGVQGCLQGHCNVLLLEFVLQACLLAFVH